MRRLSFYFEYEVYPAVSAQKTTTLSKRCLRFFVCFGINSHPIYDIDTDVQLLSFRISDPWSNGRHSSPFSTTVHAYVLSRDIQHLLPPSTRFEIAYQCTRYKRFLRRVLHSERVSLVIDIGLMNAKKCDSNHLDTGDAGLCTETMRYRNTFSSCIKRCARSSFDFTRAKSDLTRWIYPR